MYEKVKVTPYFIRYQERGYSREEYIQYFPSPSELFHAASKFCAFHDLCDDEEIIAIVIDGTEVEYYGWLPDMEIRFVNKNDPEEILWDCFYPEWDH